MYRKIALMSIAALVALALTLLLVTVAMAEPAAPEGAVGLFEQCRNDTNPHNEIEDTTCTWWGSEMSPNDSLYFEGDATPQRLHLTGLTAGSPTTFGLEWQTTNGGKHAYDYLVTWNYSENWITLADRCSGIGGCTGWAETTYPIPADPNILAGIQDMGQVFTMRNGVITGLSVYTLVGDYTGNSHTQITLTFVPTTTEVLLMWGGHIATQLDWGVGSSAQFISGKPYHMKLISPSSDNALEVALTPLLSIEKEMAIEGNPSYMRSRVFTYTISSSTATPLVSPFYLDDDGLKTPVPSIKTFVNILPGTYTVTEQTPPGTGWMVTSIQCWSVELKKGVVTTMSPSITLPQDGKGLATLVLVAPSGSSVFCTFYNLLPTAIKLDDFSARSPAASGGLVAALFGGMVVLGGTALYTTTRRKRR